MGDRPHADGPRLFPLLVAGAGGAALAGAASVALRVGSSLHALQACSAGCLALACVLHALRSRRTTPTRVPADAHSSDLRVAAAACCAGLVLWALAPWTLARAHDSGPDLPDAGVERTWLCKVSLLSTPYITAPSRILVAAEPAREPLLQLCATEHASGPVFKANLNPTLRREPTTHVPTEGARALVRRSGKTPYDLILIAPVPASRLAPLGVLPYAEAPLETVEGIRDLLAGLSPTGVLAATLLGEPATLRWLRTVRSAMTSFAGAAPERQLVVYGAGGAYSVLARRTPFDMDSVIALHIAQRRHVPDAPPTLRGASAWLRVRPALLSTPGSAFDNRIADEIRAHGPESATQHYAFDLRPPSDDRPLFFESTRIDRPDTWSSGTWFWVIAWSLVVTGLLAVALALFALRGVPIRAGERARLITSYTALALAHVLAYAFVQQRAGLWLPRPLEAPALCATVLGGSAGAWIALRGTRAGASGAARLALQLPVAALLTGLCVVPAPSPAIALRLGGAGLAWLALAGLAVVGGALALASLELTHRTPESLRRAAATIYVAALAPALLVGPGLVLASGYASCALGAGTALAIATLIAPRIPGR